MSPTLERESDKIDRLHKDFSDALIKIIDEGKEPSLHTSISAVFSKYLLVAVASDFEKRLQNAVISFAKQSTQQNDMLVSLIEIKAVNRQYHTWFDWDSSNTNSFFRLFGKDFSEKMKRQVKDDEDLKSSISTFLQIGKLRNDLVHEDFGGNNFQKTLDEVKKDYKKAKKFVDWFLTELE